MKIMVLKTSVSDNMTIVAPTLDDQLKQKHSFKWFDKSF